MKHRALLAIVFFAVCLLFSALIGVNCKDNQMCSEGPGEWSK